MKRTLSFFVSCSVEDRFRRNRENQWVCRFARFGALAAALVVAGCASAPAPRQPLASVLRDILPHYHRDHRVYLVERATPAGFEPSSLQVEHITKLDAAGELEVALSEDGVATGRVRVRDDGRTLWLVSEDDYSRGLRMSYDPPLPYLTVPLFAGEVRSESDVTLRRLADGQAAGRAQATLVTEASAAQPGEWLMGSYGSAIQLRTRRTLMAPDGDMQLSSTTLLVPGIGEVESELGAPGQPQIRRALACAIIANRAVGNCRDLAKRFR
jgi:hypothetical protein